MATSKELADDFRSLKRFYTWDKYLRFLGPRGPPQHPGAGEPQDSELMQMYERLTRCECYVEYLSEGLPVANGCKQPSLRRVTSMGGILAFQA